MTWIEQDLRVLSRIHISRELRVFGVKILTQIIVCVKKLTFRNSAQYKNRLNLTMTDIMFPQRMRCLVQGVFFTGPPVKRLKYGKPRSGESTLT